MSILGLTPGSPVADGDHKATALASFRQAFLIGGSFMGGGSVIFGAFELMRSEPDKAFKLLEIWGPWFIIALFSVWAANGLMLKAIAGVERIGDRVCDSFDKVAAEQKRLADSQDVIATAAKATAEVDDRERERMSVLIEYAGSQSREALGAVRDVQSSIADLIGHVKDAVSKTTDKG
jgi:hypothetical protein